MAHGHVAGHVGHFASHLQSLERPLRPPRHFPALDALGDLRAAAVDGHGLPRLIRPGAELDAEALGIEMRFDDLPPGENLPAVAGPGLQRHLRGRGVHNHPQAGPADRLGANLSGPIHGADREPVFAIAAGGKEKLPR